MWRLRRLWHWPNNVTRLYLLGRLDSPARPEATEEVYPVELAMKRERLSGRLQGEWTRLMESFSGLPESALNEPGPVGLWSVRDLLGHIATWEEEALKALPVILEGKTLPRYASSGGIDAFNAREQDRKGGITLAELKRDLAATHERLIAYLTSVPETAYAKEGRFLKRLRQDTYGHYREHAAQVVLWRKEQNLG